MEPGDIDTPLYGKAVAFLPSYDQALEPYRATWPAGFGFPERLLKAAVPAERAGAAVATAALASRADSKRPHVVASRARFHRLRPETTEGGHVD
jgi:hypothetical protein